MIRLLTLSFVVVAVLGCGGGTATIGNGAGGGSAATGGGDGSTGGGTATTGGGSATSGGGTATSGGGTATTGGGTASTGGGVGTTGGGVGTTGGGTATTGGGTATTGGGVGTTGGGTASTGGGVGTMGGGVGTTGGGTSSTGGGVGTTGGGVGTTGGGTACITTELLLNGNFDGTPRATGWTEYSISSIYPIVTDDVSALAPQSGDFRAWMGSWVATSGPTISDALSQYITIPANTSTLRVSGYWSVDSDESSLTTTVWDYAGLVLLHADGGQVAYPVAISNLDDDPAAWTSFNYTVDGGYAPGETLELLLGSVNDDGLPTSFFFDTLSVKATHCH